MYETAFVILSIADNGTGFDKTKFEMYRTGDIHTGLSNIQTRVKKLNGKCEIKSNPGSGTTIFVTAPY